MLAHTLSLAGGVLKHLHTIAVSRALAAYNESLPWETRHTTMRTLAFHKDQKEQHVRTNRRYVRQTNINFLLIIFRGFANGTSNTHGMNTCNTGTVIDTRAKAKAWTQAQAHTLTSTIVLTNEIFHIFQHRDCRLLFLTPFQLWIMCTQHYFVLYFFTSTWDCVK